MAKIKDESIFRGVVECRGFRFVNRGGGIWSRYKKSGNSYIHDGAITVKGRATPEKLLAASL